MFLKLVALGLTAFILVPSGAHLFELPGKINLSREAYFTVQQIYAGWAWFAVAIGAAILANGALFVSEHRRDRIAARAALISSALIVVTLVIFFIWVSQPIRRPPTGRRYPTAGPNCDAIGNTGTLRMLSSFSLPCLPPAEH